MPRRPARSDLDVAQRTKLCFGNIHCIDEGAPGVDRNASLGRITHRPGLLINLLEHEMFVTALLGLDRVPVDALDMRLDLISFAISHSHSRAVHDRHFTIAEEKEITRMRKDCRNVRG